MRYEATGIATEHGTRPRPLLRTIGLFVHHPQTNALIEQITIRVWPHNIHVDLCRIRRPKLIRAGNSSSSSVTKSPLRSRLQSNSSLVWTPFVIAVRFFRYKSPSFRLVSIPTKKVGFFLHEHSWVFERKFLIGVVPSSRFEFRLRAFHLNALYPAGRVGLM